MGFKKRGVREIKVQKGNTKRKKRSKTKQGVKKKKKKKNKKHQVVRPRGPVLKVDGGRVG